jgi:hypothetical protein
MGIWCPAIASVTCKNLWRKNSEKKGLAAGLKSDRGQKTKKRLEAGRLGGQKAWRPGCLEAGMPNLICASLPSGFPAFQPSSFPA